MGLDQYLHAKKYHSNSEWRPDEEKRLFSALSELANVDGFMDEHPPSITLEVCVGYWRKQNAIHNWFVQNCQDGNDDCQQVSVDRDQLEELRDTCRKVLANPELAGELLPTAEGFFFGSTDYDRWYTEGLTYTADRVDKLLTMSNDWYFYYQSSW